MCCTSESGNDPQMEPTPEKTPLLQNDRLWALIAFALALALFALAVFALEDHSAELTVAASMLLTFAVGAITRAKTGGSRGAAG